MTTQPLSQSEDPLQEAIEQQMKQDPSVFTPWEPPIRDNYQAFSYRELEQRLHSAALRARELTAPSVSSQDNCGAPTKQYPQEAHGPNKKK